MLAALDLDKLFDQFPFAAVQEVPKAARWPSSPSPLRPCLPVLTRRYETFCHDGSRKPANWRTCVSVVRLACVQSAAKRANWRSARVGAARSGPVGYYG